MITFSMLLNANFPELGIRRSYLIEAGEDIFGDWIVEINYGRIGCKGRKKTLLMICEEDAKNEVKKRLNRRKSAVKRIGVGYCIQWIRGDHWFEEDYKKSLLHDFITVR